MEETRQSEQSGAVAVTLTPEQNAINQSISFMKSNFPFLVDKRDRAVAALSLVKKVTTEEEDKVANNMLLKGNITYKEVLNKRMEITSKLDLVKESLMTSEKDILKQIERIKVLRNGFAQAELDRRNAEKKKIEDEKKKSDEKIRIKSELLKVVVNGLHTAVVNMEANVKKHLGNMTLENWDQMYKAFNTTPKLRPEIYAGLFSVEYNTNLVTPTEFNEILIQVKSEKSYEVCNAEYQKVAIPTVAAWRDHEAPLRKQQLEEIAALDPASAEEKIKEIAEENQTRENDLSQQLEQKFNEQKTQIETNAQNEQLQNEFNAQVSEQSITTAIPKGTRQKMAAIITAPEAEVEDVVINVVSACFASPKFPGILKRKKGIIVEPVNGVPVYEDWLSELLDFVANNTDAKIEGIELKPIVSTSARK